MTGFKAGELSVFYLSKDENGQLTQTKNPVWTRKNNHGEHWQYGKVQYDGNDETISNIILDAFASYSSSGDIAIGKFINSNNNFWLQK